MVPTDRNLKCPGINIYWTKFAQNRVLEPPRGIFAPKKKSFFVIASISRNWDFSENHCTNQLKPCLFDKWPIITIICCNFIANQVYMTFPKLSGLQTASRVTLNTSMFKKNTINSRKQADIFQNHLDETFERGSLYNAPLIRYTYGGGAQKTFF